MATEFDVIAFKMFAEATLGEIASRTRGGARLTLVVRVPGNDEADIVITNDKLENVEAAIERRRVAGG